MKQTNQGRVFGSAWPLLLGVLLVAVDLQDAVRLASAAELPASTATPYPCVGDCNNRGVVTVQDLITMVSIALDSSPISACEAGDRDNDHRIEVPEIIAAVNAVLSGCSGDHWGTPIFTPTPSPTCTPLPVCGNGRIEPPEQCDQGNTVDDDGCDSNCRVEPGFQCDGEPSHCTIAGPCLGQPPPPVCSGTPAPHSVSTPVPQRGTNRTPTPTPRAP